MTIDGGFAAIPTWMFRDERFAMKHLAVYGALATRNGQTGAVFPSIGTIANELGVSKDTVQRTLNELRTLGVVTWEKRTREDGGQTSNAYVLYTSAPAAQAGTPLPQEVPPSRTVSDPPAAGEGDEVDTPLPRENPSVSPGVAAGVEASDEEEVTAEAQAPASPEQPDLLPMTYVRRYWMPDGEWIAKVNERTEGSMTKQELRAETNAYIKYMSDHEREPHGKGWHDWVIRKHTRKVEDALKILGTVVELPDSSDVVEAARQPTEQELEAMRNQITNGVHSDQPDLGLEGGPDDPGR